MKYWKTALAILAALFASLAVAEDFKTVNGKEYKNAKVSRVEADGIVLITRSGISKVYFTELPKEVQKRFGYDADKLEAEKVAARAAEEKQIGEQKAAEREHAEKEKNAEADLKRSVEEFQSTEQRASKAYESATKGTLSGQVFVSTGGGVNFKLGAVQIGLFARDAIDALLPAVKKYADFKSQELPRWVSKAKAAEEQAEAFFALLQFPIRTAETDADGKFVIEIPQKGAFVIAAQANRWVMQDTERYYWLLPISLEGQQHLTQNLSNNNLTSTTGTASLIHTQD